jgi:hypothetical protein
MTNTDLRDKIFCKVICHNMTHFNYTYQVGRNVLQESFESDPNRSCCKGGFYVTELTNFYNYLDYGSDLWIATLCFDEAEFQIVEDPDKLFGVKW